MTEKEKMLNQQWFNPRDSELAKARSMAKQRCRTLNQQGPEPFKTHQQLAKQLFGKVRSCYIEPDFYCDYGFNIELGERLRQSPLCDSGRCPRDHWRRCNVWPGRATLIRSLTRWMPPAVSPALKWQNLSVLAIKSGLAVALLSYPVFVLVTKL